jgi:catechol 2,3-dioxygenase-like lactoylglutathione lyase family enzyme
VFDHVRISVRDVARSASFYALALAPLGYVRLAGLPGQTDVAGFGHADESDLWIRQGVPTTPPVHLAFRASSREVVEAFHRAALAAGGTDHGAPGLRPQYHPHYYGAYVLDPDGHNVEAVCHGA